VDEVQLLQTVVRAHGPAHSTVESALPKLMSYIAQAPTVESAFPKLMSYIAQEMSHELAASLPVEEVLEVLQAMVTNAKASSSGSTKETDDRALRLFKGLDRLASKPASVQRRAQQGGGLPESVNVFKDDVEDDDSKGQTESVQDDPQVIANCKEPPQDGNCAWYAECFEPDRNCGKDGYPLGFAAATCIAVDDGLTGARSTAGRAWWRATTACLQRSLFADMAKTTCGDLWGHASDYQKACFSGKKTCELDVLDAWHVTVALSTAEVRPQVFDFADKTYDQLSGILLKC
jgi:hypothetical protein